MPYDTNYNKWCDTQLSYKDFFFVLSTLTTLFMVDFVGHIINKEPNTKRIEDLIVDAQYIPTHIR